MSSKTIDRRKFLKRLGLVLGVLATSPVLAKLVPKPPAARISTFMGFKFVHTHDLGKGPSGQLSLAKLRKARESMLKLESTPGPRYLYLNDEQCKTLYNQREIDRIPYERFRKRPRHRASARG